MMTLKHTVKNWLTCVIKSTQSIFIVLVHDNDLVMNFNNKLNS